MLPDLPLRALPFMANLKYRKSNGVRVTRAVHDRISRGNFARDLRAWDAAARAYGEALDLAPDLVHIWIQLGHAEKEAGNLLNAIAAYERARDLEPDNPEAQLHLRGAVTIAGNLPTASRAHLAAALNTSGDIGATSEPGSGLFKRVEIDMQTLLQHTENDAAIARLLNPGALDGFPALPTDPSRYEDDAFGASIPEMVFDVSDLLAYFADSRMPTGIQRVQIETLMQALALPGTAVRICGFKEGRDEWVELPRDLFSTLCRLSCQGREADWSACYNTVVLRLSIAPAFVFTTGAFLINLGTSWWIPSYFSHVRQAKLEADIRYVPFVHDMIPLMRGEMCPPLLVRDFTAWTVSVLEHANFFLANSQSTKRDLLKVSNYLGRPIEPSAVEIVTLDATFDKGAERRTRASPLDRYGLRRSPYVLMVSTLEPRKNHLAAFEAWARLLQRHGNAKVPRLVCVGKPGWMNAPIYEFLDARPEVKAKVTILSHVPDDSLAQLYRSSLFTLYPSHYEGWGLPVTESLSHGKVPVCARNSSLPEAGGIFAEYFSLEFPGELVEVLERLMFDAKHRRMREDLIASDFRARSWHDIALQVRDCTHRWMAADPVQRRLAPEARLARYHSFSANLATRLWPGIRSTEGFRGGSNWWGRDLWGCWTKPGGATICLGLSDAQMPVRAYLHLMGMPNTACDFRIDIGGHEGLFEGYLAPNEQKWVPLDIAGSTRASELVEIELVSFSSEDLGKTTPDGDDRLISVGVCGFYICAANDDAARLALLEAMALGTIDTLSVNYPPAQFTTLATYLEQTLGEP